jgi:hypothetical protein
MPGSELSESSRGPAAAEFSEDPDLRSRAPISQDLRNSGRGPDPAWRRDPLYFSSLRGPSQKVDLFNGVSERQNFPVEERNKPKSAFFCS